MSKSEKQRQMEIVANNLSALLDKSQKKQVDIVRDLGMSQSVVSDYLKGNRYPPPDKMQMLADYFGVMKSDIMEEKPAHQDRLSDDKIFIIECVKRLTDYQAKLARSHMELLLSQQDNQQSK